MPVKRTFIDSDNYLFLKISILLCSIAVFLYLVHDPVGPPSGSSWLGYSLGTVAGIIILWLLWFGVRKRNYTAQRYTLLQWLSGHVWLGMSLLVLATLHCGFQFDPNIHTVFYFLMVMTILSGMVGVYFYLKIPRVISNNLRGTSAIELHEDLDLKTKEALEVARDIDPSIFELVVFARDHLFVTHRSPSKKIVNRLESVGMALLKQRGQSPSGATEQAGLRNRFKRHYSDHGMRLSAFIIDLGFDRSPGEKLQKLLDLINDILECIARIEQDRLANRRLRSWVLFHVPLSLATVVGLFVHIFSVFYY